MLLLLVPRFLFQICSFLFDLLFHFLPESCRSLFGKDLVKLNIERKLAVERYAQRACYLHGVREGQFQQTKAPYDVLEEALFVFNGQHTS